MSATPKRRPIAAIFRISSNISIHWSRFAAAHQHDIADTRTWVVSALALANGGCNSTHQTLRTNTSARQRSRNVEYKAPTLSTQKSRNAQPPRRWTENCGEPTPLAFPAATSCNAQPPLRNFCLTPTCMFVV